MKMSKLSNQTNSQDPQAINSRIFVGNLNTFQCSKTDVERMFQIYGRLAGISMHKGYAFVQFTNPFDARNACHGEDGRTILSQTLDVNMVAEPKAHQIGRKRQNITKTGNDWDYFYDSYCSSALLRGNGIRPKKRKRLMTNNTSRLLTEAVSNGNLNAAVVAAAQQQQQFNQQQHHHSLAQQQHHQQQNQHQVAAVAMAAMANLLPQQQLLLHHQNMLTNVAATTRNGVNGTPTAQQLNHNHTTLNAFIQHQQHHQHQIKQQQQQQTVAGQYAAAIAAGLQLNSTSTTLSATTSAAHQQASALISNAVNQTSPVQSAIQAVTQSSTTLDSPTAFNYANNFQTLTQTSTAASTSAASSSTSTIASIANLQQQQQSQVSLDKVTQPLTLSLPTQDTQQIFSQINQEQHRDYQDNDMKKLNQQWGPFKFKIYSNPDTLICGNCRECFSELAELLDHKRTYCKLRFTCKCQNVAFTAKSTSATSAAAASSTTAAKLLCAVCKDAFPNPWDLMVHAQAAHMVNIYELGDEDNNNNINNNNNNNNNHNDHAISNNNNNINSHIIDEINCMNTNDHRGQLNLNATVEMANFCNTIRAADISALLTKETTNFETLAREQNNNTISKKNQHDIEMTTTNAKQFEKVVSGDINGAINDASNICNNSNDATDIKFNIKCNSPTVSILKEDIIIHDTQQRDDVSLDGHMSISSQQTHRSDEIKHMNGSISSRGSSPALLDNDEQQQKQQECSQQQMQQSRACIMRTLSIEATDKTPLKILSSNPASRMNLTSGTTSAAAPQ